MKKIFLLILAFLIFISCKKEQIRDEKLLDGTYKGTFQRELSWSDSDTANITLTFSFNQWSGSGERSKYPALYHGTYSMNGDTIIFGNACAWTAEFDWSLILSGKYLLTITGDTIEFSRDNRSSTSGIYVDRYRLKRQE